MNSLYTYGGEERVVSSIASELYKNYDVTIYTYETRRSERLERNDYYLADAIRVEVIDGDRDNLFQFAVKTLYYRTGLSEGKLSQFLLKKAYYPDKLLDFWIQKINQEEFDIVISISGYYSMLLGYIADSVSAKLIGWEHSSFEGYFDKHTGYYRNRMETYSKLVSRLDACIVLNEDVQQKFKEQLLIDAIVIPNPRSFTSEEKADVTQQCFVACGRVEREKGFDDLIEAFYQFNCENDGWKLLIIGGGSLQKKFEELAKQKGISDKVTFTGYIRDVRHFLLQGSVFIHPSRWEGFGMTVLEALEMGLPVIAYSIPAMKLLISDGEDGIIVPAFDNMKLVQAMKKLACDKDLREKMGREATKEANLFDITTIANAWMELL